jgi:hypothetical protein
MAEALSLVDGLAVIGGGISRLGTPEAVSIGAYAYALNRLDEDSGARDGKEAPRRSIL